MSAGPGAGTANIVNGAVIDRDRLHRQAVGQPERGAQCVPLRWMAAHLGEADIGEFEAEQSGDGQTRTLQACGDGLGLRLAEQQGGEGRGVHDLNPKFSLTRTQIPLIYRRIF